MSGGFRLAEPPAGLAFHPGHTWVGGGPEGAVAGVDGFGARLLPRATALKLPPVGRLLDQGDPAFEVLSGDRRAVFLAPVAGRVVGRNAELAARPGLLLEDPYGAGWVLRLRPRHWARDRRNLLLGQVAFRWLEASVEDLRVRIAGLSGSVIQPAEGVGFLACLPAANWEALAAELLHSAA